MHIQVAYTRSVNIADATVTDEKGDAPLRPDLGDRSNVRLRGEHKLVEDDPLGRRLEPARGVERDNLVVLHCQVRVLLALLVRDLHEVPAHERLAHVCIQLALVLGRHEIDLVSLHVALQLRPHVICLQQRTAREVVRPRPVFVEFVCCALVSLRLGRWKDRPYFVDSGCTH